MTGSSDRPEDDEAPEDDLTEPQDADHALPRADLQYPTVEFDEGGIDDSGGFDLQKAADREEMSAVATDLAGALSSHDLGVEADDDFTTLGVAPESVAVSFDPDEDGRGELEVTFRLSATAMFVADAADQKVGSRGDAGFVPLSMLTDERDQHRCYGWIDDHEDPD